MAVQAALPAQRPPRSRREAELSVVMPCLNEAETLAACIDAALTSMAAAGIIGEVVVADNGSRDGSQEIARAHGARVVDVAGRGYGSALRGGIGVAKGRYIVMGDADHSYDFAAIPEFLAKLREGYDLVMGNRFRGGIEDRAMPWLHRRIGNPILSGLGRLFFHSSVRDFHCGLRGFSREAFNRMDLSTDGMEFASEMVVKASLHQMRIAEVPTVLRKDGRSRAPHLRTWRDGWRHLRFMLLYSPRWLFMVPGGLLFLSGALASLWLVGGPRRVAAIGFDIHTLLVAGLACIVGFQLIVFAVFTKVFVIREGLHPPSATLGRLNKHIKLETGLLAGGLMTAAGGVSLVAAALGWASDGFGALDPRQTMRIAIPACVLVALGIQTIFASFFLSILGVPRRDIDRRRHPRN